MDRLQPGVKTVPNRRLTAAQALQPLAQLRQNYCSRFPQGTSALRVHHVRTRFDGDVPIHDALLAKLPNCHIYLRIDWDALETVQRAYHSVRVLPRLRTAIR